VNSTVGAKRKPISRTPNPKNRLPLHADNYLATPCARFVTASKNTLFLKPAVIAGVQRPRARQILHHVPQWFIDCNFFRRPAPISVSGPKPTNLDLKSEPRPRIGRFTSTRLGRCFSLGDRLVKRKMIAAPWKGFTNVAPWHRWPLRMGEARPRYP
jgi:hypothetical protein